MKFKLFIFILWITPLSWSQTLLTLEDALRIGIQNNYDIVIARNAEDAAKYSRNIGNAGMLPSVNLNGTVNFANSNIDQQFSNGLAVNQNNVRADNYNASAQLSWVLFDGLKMFATYGRLNQLKSQSEVNTRIQIELVVQKIVLAYYNIVKQNQLVGGLTKNLTVYEERLKIAEKRLNVGSAAKVEVLQAKIDLNNQRANLMQQQMLLQNYKTALNQLLIRPLDTEFTTVDQIPVDELPQLAELKTEVMQKNNALQFAVTNIEITKFTKREILGDRFPQLTFNSSYVFARSENQAGFALFNQSLGFNVGFGVSYNIFNGWRTNTQAKNAKINWLNAQLTYKNVQLQTDTDLRTNYNAYMQARDVLNLAEENSAYAEENLSIALELFKLGQITTVEIKQIQQTFDDAITSLVTARYNVKLYETELLRLSGSLVRS